MDDFLVNRIMEDFTKGTMTAQEAWSNLQEGRESISDEKYDEVVGLIIEELITSEEAEIDDPEELEEYFNVKAGMGKGQLEFDWDDVYRRDEDYVYEPDYDGYDFKG